MTYHLEVYGYLWGGGKAVYSYVIPAAIKADEEANRAAGDFESLIDWRLVENTCTYERTSSPPITRRIDTYRTLRGWHAGMTCKRFYRLANGG